MTELKTPEFAPTPSAGVMTAIKVKPDFFADIRNAKFSGPGTERLFVT